MASGSDVRLELTSKGVTFGHITALPDGTVDTSEVKGVDPDLIVKPFHQAGAVLSIREFTVNAMNHHHGMQAEERFDLNPAKGPDFDEDGISRELTIGDITAGAVFQAQLGTPGRVVPETEAERESAAHGEILFEQVGCTTCHVPMLELDSSMFGEPYGRNPDGTFSDSSTTFWLDLTTDGEEPRLESNGDGGAYVRAYTDLKRHNLCDEEIDFFCNEQLTQGRPDQDGRPGTEFFLTRKLWDVGNSAPYGHRGDLPTITEAILYHGGEARESRDAFVSLSAAEQADIVGFLKTLQVLPPAPSATDDGPPWVWMIVSALVAAVVVGVAVWYVGFRRTRRPSPAS